MKTFIHRIIEDRRKAREEKKLAWRRSHIARCIEGSSIKNEDLIPILDDEYDQLVADLKKKVQQMKPEESEFTHSDFRAPDGTDIKDIPLRNIFAWREIVASMKSRVRDAYHIKNRPCGKCGEDNTVFFCFRSSDESWRELCGREGYMLICPECLTILGFVHYVINYVFTVKRVRAVLRKRIGPILCPNGPNNAVRARKCLFLCPDGAGMVPCEAGEGGRGGKEVPIAMSVCKIK